MGGPLAETIALVTGATRGAGRGIALQLGEAGACVYVTGRTSGQPGDRNLGADRPPGTIEETAAEVTARGGRGIPVVVDHLQIDQVDELILQIGREQGRLDLLVNNIWGGDELTHWEGAFWEHPLHDGLLMQERALHTHMITTHRALPLLLKSSRGLIIETTDGDGLGYRGSLFFDLVKIGAMRLAYGMSYDLKEVDIAAVALTAGYMRTEVIMQHFGVTEETWEARLPQVPDEYFKYSETTEYVGRAVVALASDPNIMEKTGRALHTHKLAEEYGFIDVNGKQPLPWGS